MALFGRPTEIRSTRKPNEIDHGIGQRLRKWRLAQDIEACELAHRLGITQQQLQKYEKGQTRIAASRLHEIAHMLGIPVHWFFREPTSSDDQPQFLTQAPTGSNTSNLQAFDDGCSAHSLLRHYLKIEDKGVRRALFDLVATLVANNPDASGKANRAERNGL